MKQKNKKTKNLAVSEDDKCIPQCIPRRNLFHCEHITNVFHFRFESLDSALMICKNKFFDAIKSFFNFVKSMTNFTESVFNINFSSSFRESSLDHRRQVLNFYLLFYHIICMLDWQNMVVNTRLHSRRNQLSPQYGPMSEYLILSIIYYV